MKALIKDNKIVQVVEEQFEVHPDYKWVDCPNDCNTFWTYINSEFVPPEPIHEDLDPLPMRDEMINALWKAVSMEDKSEMAQVQIIIDQAKS